jgi:putative YhbY family RNA-binding protein
LNGIDMAELTLSHDQIITLRASAHALDPVVLMGAAGLSPALIKEIDRALRSHGLVKVRGGKSERAEREAMFLAMAEELEAARVQVIGNTFVLFRPIPPAEEPENAPARTGKKPAKRAPGKSAGRTTGNFARGDAQKERIAVKRATVRGAAPRSAGPSGFGAGKRAGAAPPPRKRAPSGGTRQR